MPTKVWAVGEEVLAADFNTYVQNQVVSTFANKAALDAWAAPNGALGVTTDTYTVYERIAGVWLSTSELDYAQATANVACASTLPSTATAIVTGAALTLPAMTVIVEFWGHMSTPSQASASFTLNLWDGATDLGYIAQVGNPPGGGPITATLSPRKRIVVTAGPHQFSVRGWVSAGAGTLTAGPGGVNNWNPTFLRVTKA